MLLLLIIVRGDDGFVLFASPGDDTNTSRSPMIGGNGLGSGGGIAWITFPGGDAIGTTLGNVMGRVLAPTPGAAGC
jgi:hypothetical protein